MTHAAASMRRTERGRRVSRGDGAAVAALYTSDGRLLPVQNDFVTGKEAIKVFWQAAFDAGIKGASLETVEFESHGNSAHEVGKYKLLDADGKVLDHGKFIVIWKKDGETWKLHRDIWTTSVAPKQP
jgi:ketosteroid isomerase-like protein